MKNEWKTVNFQGEDNSGLRRGFTEMVNVDLMADGSVKTREGYSLISAGAAHSMFSNGKTLLFRRGNDLYRMEKDNTVTPVASGMQAGKRARYLSIGNKIYITDGVSNKIYDELNGELLSWGTEPPPPPVVTTVTGGLPKGIYLVAFTYLRRDGQESPPSGYVTVDASVSGGFQTTIPAAPSDTSVVKARLYISGVGAETLYHVADLPLGGGSAVADKKKIHYGKPLENVGLSPLPVGTMAEFLGGRIFVPAGNVLWYSEPWKYELCNLATNFFQFEGAITMVKATENGMYVSTTNKDETVFLRGTDPQAEGGMPIVQRYNVSAIEGSALAIDSTVLPQSLRVVGTGVVFATNKGFFFGGNDGVCRQLTTKRYTLDGAQDSSAVLIEDPESIKIVVSSAASSVNGTMNVDMPMSGTVSLGGIA